MNKLHDMCQKKDTLRNIREYIDKNNIDPDQECIRLACKHKNYVGAIRYFTNEWGLAIDRECIDNARPNVGATASFMMSKIELK